MNAHTGLEHDPERAARAARAAALADAGMAWAHVAARTGYKDGRSAYTAVFKWRRRAAQALGQEQASRASVS